MELDINGEIYDIRWRHERIRMPDNILPNGGKTIAYMIDTQGNTLEASANCSIKDTYNKKLGRIIATGRLLKKLGLDTKKATQL